MNRNDDLSENLNYTDPELPILTSDEHLSELPTYRELMHWHDDYEFILVTKGTLNFDVNGEILHIKPNEGIFVNSGRLHYGYSEDMKEVLHFIQKHYTEKITVSDIASSAMICRNQCFRLFQQLMKMTPQQYLTQYRINKSIEIMNTRNGFAEIAQSCGFCSQSHYTKAFKALYGMTTKQYQLKER